MFINIDRTVFLWSHHVLCLSLNESVEVKGFLVCFPSQCWSKCLEGSCSSIRTEGRLHPEAYWSTLRQHEIRMEEREAPVMTAVVWQMAVLNNIDVLLKQQSRADPHVKMRTNTYLKFFLFKVVFVLERTLWTYIIVVFCITLTITCVTFLWCFTFTLKQLNYSTRKPLATATLNILFP